jgi:hypothetical protein
MNRNELGPEASAIPVTQERDGVPVPKTMDDLQAHFRVLDHDRGQLWAPSRRERIRLLDFANGELGNFIVKGAPEPEIKVMFARIPRNCF